jgi:hypothetical protein
MGSSVPRNITHRGDYLSRCDDCGAVWLRSSLRRGRDGLLRCENDRPGRNALELAELTAARASALSAALGRQLPNDGAVPDVDSTGQVSSSSSYPGTSRRRTVEQVYAEGVPTYANPGTKNNLPGF